MANTTAETPIDSEAFRWLANGRASSSKRSIPLSGLDGFLIKVEEEGFVRKKSVYCVLAVNTEGTKDLLSIYLA